MVTHSEAWPALEPDVDPQCRLQAQQCMPAAQSAFSSQ